MEGEGARFELFMEAEIAGILLDGLKERTSREPVEVVELEVEGFLEDRESGIPILDKGKDLDQFLAHLEIEAEAFGGFDAYLVEAMLEGFGELFGGADMVEDTDALLCVVVCGDAVRELKSLWVRAPEIEAGLIEVACAFVVFVRCGECEESVDIVPLFEDRVTACDLKACGEVCGIESKGVLEVVDGSSQRTDLQHDTAEECVGFGVWMALLEEFGEVAERVIPSMSVEFDKCESIERIGMIGVA